MSELLIVPIIIANLFSRWIISDDSEGRFITWTLVSTAGAWLTLLVAMQSWAYLRYPLNGDQLMVYLANTVSGQGWMTVAVIRAIKSVGQSRHH